MVIRLWLSNWSATAFHIIKLLRNNPDGAEFIIYGTDQNKHFPYLKSCDYIEVSSSLTGEEYIDYCLEFCKKHRIDVFMPYTNLSLISEHLHSFEEMGTKVLLCGDTGTLRIIMNRGELYDICKKNKLASLPDYHIVKDREHFMDAYRDLHEKGYRVCMKPCSSEGEEGFRIIDEKADTIQRLFGVLTPSVSIDTVCRSLSLTETFRDLMVFKYFSGHEYTVDCLACKGKLLTAIPVKKVDGRVRSIEKNTELIEIAKKITEFFSLSYNFSINVRFDDNVPVLIDINPGLSSEVNISSMCGINYPYCAVKLLLKGEGETGEPKFDIIATQIESNLLL